MQAFKLDHFRKDRPGHTFPPFQSLDASEAEIIRTRLAEKAGLASPVDPLALTQQLAARAVLLEGVNAESADFDLTVLLRSRGVWPRPEVYINWYRFDEIDRMAFADLAANFVDVWYPSADDVELFDATFAWVLSVNHEGMVKILRFERS